MDWAFSACLIPSFIETVLMGSTSYQEVFQKANRHLAHVWQLSSTRFPLSLEMESRHLSPLAIRLLFLPALLAPNSASLSLFLSLFLSFIYTFIYIQYRPGFFFLNNIFFHLFIIYILYLFFLLLLLAAVASQRGVGITSEYQSQFHIDSLAGWLMEMIEIVNGTGWGALWFDGSVIDNWLQRWRCWYLSPAR